MVRVVRQHVLTNKRWNTIPARYRIDNRRSRQVIYDNTSLCCTQTCAFGFCQSSWGTTQVREEMPGQRRLMGVGRGDHQSWMRRRTRTKIDQVECAHNRFGMKTDRRMGGQTDRQTDKQRGSQTGAYTNSRTHCQADKPPKNYNNNC